MRIEHQGYIEVQPAYQHVGYVSAAYNIYATPNANASPTWLVGGGVLMVALALMTLRRSGSWAKLVGCVFAMAAVGAGLAAAHAARQPTITLIPEFYQTLYNLELATHDTDRMAGKLGRPPTREEWARQMTGKPYARDGWGYPLEYQRDKQGASFAYDERSYRVVAVPERMAGALGYVPTDRVLWDIGSDWLGTDGVLGTADDYRGMTHKLQEAGWTPADRPQRQAADTMGGGGRENRAPGVP